jgi:ZIP family zinc transporter
MAGTVALGLLIPLLGTTLGAAMVFFMKGEIKPGVQKMLLGFAAGVMIAASVWSLLNPAIEMSTAQGLPGWLPPAAGFMAGVFFLLFLDSVIPHLHMDSSKPEGPASALKKNTMLVLAVTIHNFPEGMAVGVVFAGVLSGQADLSVAAAMSLSIGIAIQNFPEGAVISMPLAGNGAGKGKAFLYGFLSGVVEPAGALLTIALTGLITPLLPYILSFAAGAMIYVVVEELVPEAQAGDSEGAHTNIGTIGCAVGFVLMMILDVALG